MAMVKRVKGKGITMDVCHVTGDSRDFAFLISVPLSALKAHLDHGDHEPDSQGSCEDDPTIPPI